MSIELNHAAVVIDGRPTFVYSGEIQPYRLPAGLWQDRLEKARAAGLNCVGCYFGWNFHAPDADTVDFASPDRDLARFLELAAQAGLYVLVRPGPYVCNEWDLGGFPGWLLAQPQGDWRTGDPRHLAWARRWYSQINPVLAPYEHGRQGSIILYQVENEHFWGDKLLFEGLVGEARANGITVPLVSNSGGSVYLVGAQGLVDGMDCYTDTHEFVPVARLGRSTASPTARRAPADVPGVPRFHHHPLGRSTTQRPHPASRVGADAGPSLQSRWAPMCSTTSSRWVASRRSATAATTSPPATATTRPCRPGGS